MNEAQKRLEGEQPEQAPPTEQTPGGPEEGAAQGAPASRPRMTPEEREAAIARAQAARAERMRAAERARAAREREGVSFETAGGAAAEARVGGPAAAVRPPVARAVAAPLPSRRTMLRRIAFWSALGAAIVAGIAQFMDFFYPRGVTGFGGPVPAGKVSDYPPGGDPKHNIEGRFWMVHITPEKGGEGKYQGLLALWHRCPHLGCTVPWRPEFAFQGKTGWFRCPCHGSTYTMAGVRVFGPAPRSMDTMEIQISPEGNITVQTGRRIPGGITPEDNPSRAVKV